MIDAARPRVVAFVPAKGESDRIRGKNLRILDGEHLFKRKLRQLLECELVDEVCLDSESDELAMLADDLPVRRLRRPAELATNATDGHELFAWETAQVDAGVYVQALCTAPFVDAAAVDRAIAALLAAPERDSLVGVRRETLYTWTAEGAPAYGAGRIPNSVDLPRTPIEAMSLYAVRRPPGAPAPRRRFGAAPLLFELTPREAIDVNVPADLELAEAICAGDRAASGRRLRALRPHLSSSMLADVGEVLGTPVALPERIRATSPGRFLGRAKTLALARSDGPDGGGTTIYDALDSYDFVRSGDVIVVSTERPDRAYFGDLNANLALRSGAVGVVVDGMTRDSPWVRQLGLPVYAHGSHCVDVKNEGRVRSMNKPVVVGGVEVRNGDYLFADEDGVVCIPADRWAAFVEMAMTTMEREWRIRLAAVRGDAPREILERFGAF